MKPINVEEVRKCISDQSAATRIYLGCDSERVKLHNGWWADYTLAVVVHINGNSGCKIFGEVQRDRDYDQRVGRPALRLMNEVYKVSDLYQKLSDVLINRSVEVHLDINPDERHGSNCVIAQAIGYIKGTCNVTPSVKPYAFAASYAADRFKGLAGARLRSVNS